MSSVLNSVEAVGGSSQRYPTDILELEGPGHILF